MRGDGDGWSWSPDGSRYWGRHGAAGLLLRAPIAGGRPAVLLQHRAVWSHQGGTWALPGGARDSHETSVHAAVREAEEEAGISSDLLQVRAERITMQATGGWSYTTVVADAPQPLDTVRNGESAELRWVPEDEVAALPLHPGFLASWDQLRTRRVHLMIDPEVDRAVLREVLPRTVDLPGRGFCWLPGVEDAVDSEASGAGLTVLVTSGDAPARDLPRGVVAVALSAITGR